MKHYGPEGACVLCDDDIVIVGICIGDATAARRHAVKAAFEEWLEKDQERARSWHLLSLDQLFSTPELARGDVILDVGDNHRNDGEWLRNAGDLGDHSFLHDLRFDLAEARLQASLASALRDENPGGTHQWIHDISDAKNELFHPPIHACADDCFI